MGAYLWIFQRPTKSGKLNYDFHKVCEGINASKLIKLRVCSEKLLSVGEGRASC
jgi:hypothetical protein